MSSSATPSCVRFVSRPGASRSPAEPSPTLSARILHRPGQGLRLTRALLGPSVPLTRASSILVGEVVGRPGRAAADLRNTPWCPPDVPGERRHPKPRATVAQQKTVHHSSPGKISNGDCKCQLRHSTVNPQRARVERTCPLVHSWGSPRRSRGRLSGRHRRVWAAVRFVLRGAASPRDLAAAGARGLHVAMGSCESHRLQTTAPRSETPSDLGSACPPPGAGGQGARINDCLRRQAGGVAAMPELS